MRIPDRGRAPLVDLALEVPAEVAAVAVLQVGSLPVAAVDSAPASGCATVAGHLRVVVVEQGVIGGELLAPANIAHGGEHDIAGESDVGSQE